MNRKSYDIVMRSIWSLAEKGLANLTVENIASDSGVSLLELSDLFPQQKNILLAMLEDIKQQVTMPEVDNRLTRRDQVFDVAMMYFDAAQPHRLAIKKLSEDLIWNPYLLMQVLPYLYSLGESIVMKYLPEDKDRGGIRYFGKKLSYNGVFTHALYIFLADETFDLSKTMAALDNGLKKIDDLC